MPFLNRKGQVCGFLNYEEKENSGRFCRRYFIISSQERAVLCFHDSPSNLPEGSKPLMQISLSIISNARDVSKQRPKVELCFVISTPQRNHYFTADNQEEKDDWIFKVNNACKVTVPSKAPKSPTHSIGESKTDQTSYRTEIVGGVVMRTPVNTFHHPVWYLPINARLLKLLAHPQEYRPIVKQYHSYIKTPAGTVPTTTSGMTRAPQMSDSDSDEDHHHDRRSLPNPGQHHQGTAISTNPSKYIVEGWCVKQGAVRKNWKRRYFALSEHGVSYFKSESDKVPIRTIPLAEIISCKVSGQWSVLQRDNLFEINCYARTFFVQAYSPEEMQTWVSAISSRIINESDGNIRADSPCSYDSKEDTHL